MEGMGMWKEGRELMKKRWNKGREGDKERSE